MPVDRTGQGPDSNRVMGRKHVRDQARGGRHSGQATVAPSIRRRQTRNRDVGEGPGRLAELHTSQQSGKKKL